MDDAFGVDFKVPRTIRDLVIRPGRVFDAAARGDHSLYTRPLRFFLAVTAIQFLIFGLTGATESLTFGGLFEDQPAALAAAETRLAEAGSSLEHADEITLKWLSWLNWPLTIMLSFVLVLVIWMLRPRLGVFRSFMLYLTTVNASTVAALPLLVTSAFFGAPALGVASLVRIPLFLAYIGVVMHARITDNAVRLWTNIVILALAFVLILILFNVLALLILELALRLEIGVGWFDVFVAGYEAMR